ncbi:RAE1 [Symbiodinium sp. CCMP2592]|nr:RAE1 [Symbiodinium sp. CCMP2592]
MASRLSCRRSTIGPRHSLLLRPAEEVPTELRGLPEELTRRIATATSESELRDVAGEVVEEALLLLDHRGLIKDLDKIWPTTRACKQLGTSEVLTLTSAIKMSLASTLRDTAQRGVMPRRKVLALFNFLAELCWANYMCPSEHAIQKAMHCLLDTAWALTECAGNSEPAGWYVESCAYFLARVGEIIMLNPLEVFNVLDPLSARLASLARQLPRRTKSFVWLLLRRREMMWRGSLQLSISPSYWQAYSGARLVLTGHFKGDPKTCYLAELPWCACASIMRFICEGNSLDAAEAVWSIENHAEMPSTDDWLSEFLEQLPATPKAREGVRIYEVTAQNIAPRMAYNHEAPVLCCAFSKDGQRVFSGGCDNKVKMKVLQTQQEQQIGQHDGPVKEVFVVDEMNMVVSGSWDRTLRFWNLQQPTPVATLQLPERVYTMDVKYPLLVVGCAERHVLVYNLQAIQQNPAPYKQGQTALKMQTRVICCFPDKTGYAVGSIEGRCSIAHIEDTSKNFAFKCHRTNTEIYAVNDIDFHPTMGTFATCGGDGTFVYWDKENRQRLKAFNSCHYPLTSGKFNAPGDMYAYAVSYDWSKGHEQNHPSLPKGVLVHKVQATEVQPKAGSANQRAKR